MTHIHSLHRVSSFTSHPWPCHLKNAGFYHLHGTSVLQTGTPEASSRISWKPWSTPSVEWAAPSNQSRSKRTLPATLDQCSCSCLQAWIQDPAWNRSDQWQPQEGTNAEQRSWPVGKGINILLFSCLLIILEPAIYGRAMFEYRTNGTSHCKLVQPSRLVTATKTLLGLRTSQKSIIFA